MCRSPDRRRRRRRRAGRVGGHRRATDVPRRRRARSRKTFAPPPRAVAALSKQQQQRRAAPSDLPHTAISLSRAVSPHVQAGPRTHTHTRENPIDHSPFAPRARALFLTPPWAPGAGPDSRGWRAARGARQPPSKNTMVSACCVGMGGQHTHTFSAKVLTSALPPARRLPQSRARDTHLAPRTPHSFTMRRKSSTPSLAPWQVSSLGLGAE